MLRIIRVPAGSTRGPLYMDQVLAAWHQGNLGRLPLTLAFAHFAGHVGLFCRFPDELQGLVEGQLYAQYPEANLAPLPEAALAPPADAVTWSAEIDLRPGIFPCKRYQQFQDDLNRTTADSLTGILTALTGETDSSLCAAIEITVQPARRSRIHRSKHCIRKLSYPFFRTHHHWARLFIVCALSDRWPIRLIGALLGRLARRSDHPDSKALDSSGSRVHEREEDLLAASEKAGRLLFETSICLRVSAPPDREVEAMRMLTNLAAAFGQFALPRLSRFHMSRIRRHESRRSSTFLLSTEELATIFHPATATVQAPAMAIVESREAEPPPDLPTPARQPGLAVLGMATYRGQEQPCGILQDGRRRHLYVCGKTGKTNEDVANAFHVPLAFLTTQTNLANLQAADHQHMTKAIGPRLQRRDEKLNEQLIPIYDPTRRLFLASEDPSPVDPEQAWRTMRINMEFGIITINEARDAQGLSPVPWGEKPWPDA